MRVDLPPQAIPSKMALWAANLLLSWLDVGRKQRRKAQVHFSNSSLYQIVSKTMDLQPYGQTKFSKMSWFKITVKAIVINNHCFYCSILFLFFYWELIFFQQRALQGALQVKCCRKQQSPEQPGYVNRTEMKLILGKKLCWIRQFRYVKIYTWLRDHISVVLLSKRRSKFWIFICQ